MSWIEEIRSDIATVKQTKKDLRKFGFLVGGVAVAVSAFAFWKSWWTPNIIVTVCAIGIVLIVFGALLPMRLKSLHKYWMAFAVILGSIVSRVILFILFFIIVSPLSILAKVFGKKFFVSYKDSSQTTYWITRDNNKPINYERM